MDPQVLQHLLQMAAGRGTGDSTTPLLAVVTGWRRGQHRQAKLIHKLRKRLDADPAMDLDARGTAGKTALHLLIDARLNAAARFLVERGADPLAVDADGKSALLLAAMGTKGEEGLGTAFFLAWALNVARERLPAAPPLSIGCSMSTFCPKAPPMPTTARPCWKWPSWRPTTQTPLFTFCWSAAPM
ncbi:ankyrin repeat protein [Pandoravirus inopinatum]|uniref:Ankyrin repeat protein n=1 Tax=Pandoravirus inopinatum TaxID=1605721 RepID=A0A0B5J3G1_9VIRU|nr:ankyrin repeat protein [Pandoravirus inopinatum]AJF98119.1 ankyrin repeat protein [Pandoravirus inopinatum]